MTDAPVPLTRRHFLFLAGTCVGGLILGCTVNPVSGRRQLILVSESDERRIDRENSPHQFSADYGQVPDPQLVRYIQGVGASLAGRTHRPDLPYRFVPLNATYVNAYTFPGGSVGITRGILLELGSEAELAALIGHELGHVNARHTAQQMSKGVLAALAVSGLASAAGDMGERSEKVAAGLGQIASGALLARYSRDNEREADSLALEYMVRAGYGPSGHTRLMDMLRSLSSRKPGAIELMFATHPMSEDRYRSSVAAISRMPASSRELPTHRERYMDNTIGLRAMSGAIGLMQEGDRLMKAGKFREAEGQLMEALRLSPGDYAALLMTARCQLALERAGLARRYAEDAAAVYPGEPQALHLLGMAELSLERYDAARLHCLNYEKSLPGNPNTVFFIGRCAEGMGDREEAANRYLAYLKEVDRGENAQYAYSRLRQWGYVK
ncbi:MAG: M48 family metalloprotease [bacterium]|nr:MAG: M48 family metalloprotease [bacterium]